MTRLCSDAYINARIDNELRGQPMTINGKSLAWSAAPTLYWALLDSGGVELTGNNYARVPYLCSLANWAGTQGAGTTTASSGTSAQTSNNVDVVFNTPSAAWVPASYWALYDALTGGTQLYKVAMTQPKAAQPGDPAKILAGQAALKLDS